MDKKGTDKIISVYWFAMLFLVASAVVYMVISFYGKPYDVREIESEILAKNIADCISKSGTIETSVMENSQILLDETNFFEKCNLNFEVEDYSGWLANSEYFVEVDFVEFESGISSGKISVGNFNLKDYCGEKFGKEKNNPVCLERKFYSIDNLGKGYEIKINSLVRKTEKNVN